MKSKPAIWIDLDNAPHAHFFAPLVRELQVRGYRPLITLRAFGQTEGLARSYGMQFTRIGEHRAYTSQSARIFATLRRAAALVEFAAAHRPVAAASHGSRALTLAAAALQIPCLACYDYEHISAAVFHRLCRKVLVPEVVHRHCRPMPHRVGYPGFKEDVYVHDRVRDTAILERLGLKPDRLIASVRPPATWAHYHCDESTVLFRALMERLRGFAAAEVVVMARSREQADDLRQSFGLNTPPFRVISEAIDGLSLMACSDAVFSGGGTMVREAALLGVPAYSTFAGIAGAVDLELERTGKLVLLRTVEQISHLQLEKQRTRPSPPPTNTREFIVNEIVKLATPERKFN